MVASSLSIFWKVLTPPLKVAVSSPLEEALPLSAFFLLCLASDESAKRIAAAMSASVNLIISFFNIIKTHLITSL